MFVLIYPFTSQIFCITMTSCKDLLITKKFEITFYRKWNQFHNSEKWLELPLNRKTLLERTKASHDSPVHLAFVILAPDPVMQGLLVRSLLVDPALSNRFHANLACTKKHLGRTFVQKTLNVELQSDPCTRGGIKIPPRATCIKAT